MSPGYAIVVAAGLSMFAMPVNAQQQNGPYVGVYGGLGGISPNASTQQSTTTTLPPEQPLTPDFFITPVSVAEDAIRSGVPIEFTEQLNFGRTCDQALLLFGGGPNGGNGCYRSTDLTRINVQIAQRPGPQPDPDNLGITNSILAYEIETTEQTTYDAGLLGLGGVVIGYKLGQLRAELDAGVNVFEVTRSTTITTTRRIRRETIVPEGVEPQFAEAHERQLDRAEQSLRNQSPPTGTATAVNRSTERQNAWIGSINALYDIPLDTTITPYVGGGAGIALINSDESFAWNVQAGLQTEIGKSVTLSMGYRYQRIEDTEFGDLQGHSGLVGLRTRW